MLLSPYQCIPQGNVSTSRCIRWCHGRVCMCCARHRSYLSEQRCCISSLRLQNPQRELFSTICVEAQDALCLSFPKLQLVINCIFTLRCISLKTRLSPSLFLSGFLRGTLRFYTRLWTKWLIVTGALKRVVGA